MRYPPYWDEWPESARGIFEAMRLEAGKELVLESNVFVECILPSNVIRDPTEEEMEVYRRPYREPGESHRPRSRRFAEGDRGGRRRLYLPNRRLTSPTQSRVDLPVPGVGHLVGRSVFTGLDSPLGLRRQGEGFVHRVVYAGSNASQQGGATGRSVG